jgi:glycine/D-amino acid oxidase-like deaminating enzyme/nitrite reductase/ring-hydroxylating ferredoxin subunit
MERDGSNKSLWQQHNAYQVANTANLNDLYDVIIIGGGITGLTTAVLLQASGKKCLLIEAHTIGFGTTGGTTAHLNTFFDTPYNKVIKNFGANNAKLLAQGAKSAISLIKKNISDYNIDCDFTELDGYLFSINEAQDRELIEITDACKELGVAAAFTNESPFPIPYLKMTVFKNQAQFNPIKYIFSLAKKYESLGGKIVEHNRVLDVDAEGDEVAVKTEKGVIKGYKAVYATHIPPGVNLLHLRCAPYRSYAIAVKLKSEKYPAALGYDMNDPYHYYRTQNVEGQNYLIVGGEDHKTGHETNTDACFRRLESHVKSYFDVKEVAFKWSSQFYEPVDGLPYIGKLPGTEKNIYVATGYGGNGMIYGTLAAITLSNLFINGKSVYADLFDPGRSKPVAGFSNFVKENADVVKHLIADKFAADKIKELTEIAPGEGRIIKHDGHVLALYKDNLHEVHLLNPVCTHLKCNVAWNSSEKSWDCPCHGARYSIEGDVLTGPARHNLEKVNVTSAPADQKIS